MKRNLIQLFGKMIIFIGVILLFTICLRSQNSISSTTVTHGNSSDSIPELDISNFAIFDTIFGSYVRDSRISIDKKPFMVIYDRNDTIYCDCYYNPTGLIKNPYNGYFTHNGRKCFVLNDINTEIPLKENGLVVIEDYKAKDIYYNEGTYFDILVPTVTSQFVFRYAITNKGTKFELIGKFDYSDIHKV